MSDLPSGRGVSLVDGLRYRGKSGMWNWALHRVTGVGILLFVGLHVAASFAGQKTGSDLAFAVNAAYQSWQFQLFVCFCVLYHAFNGARLAAMDLAPPLVRFHRELVWLEWAVLVPVYGLAAFTLVARTAGG